MIPINFRPLVYLALFGLLALLALFGIGLGAIYLVRWIFF